MQITEGKIRPAETPLKAPPVKKARITAPSMGKKTGEKCHIQLQTPVLFHGIRTSLCDILTLQAVVPLRKVATSMLQPLIHHQSRWRQLVQSLTALSNPLAMPASRAASKVIYHLLYQKFFQLNVAMHSDTWTSFWVVFRTFYSSVGLETHCKVKHNARKWSSING